MSSDLTASREIPRALLKVDDSSRAGWFDPCLLKRRWWDETWHVGLQFAFCTRKSKCDTCSKVLEKGDLISQGKRYLASEHSKVAVEGGDKACLDCVYDDDYDRPEYKVPENDDENKICLNKDLSDVLKDVEVQGLPGFGTLSTEDRKKFVEAKLGRTIDDAKQEDLLQPKNQKLCDGWICVVTGAFDDSCLNLKILENGGQIVNAVTNQVTHCIVGAPAEGAFGGKSGPNSKKAKESRKKKKVMLTEQEFVDIVVERTRTMDDLLQERKVIEDEKKKQAKERAAERKREAAAALAAMEPRRTRSRR